MTRITYSSYGNVEHLYSSASKEESIEEFWKIFGQSEIPRNTGGIQIIHVGTASDVKDTSGFVK